MSYLGRVDIAVLQYTSTLLIRRTMIRGSGDSQFMSEASICGSGDLLKLEKHALPSPLQFFDFRFQSVRYRILKINVCLSVAHALR